MTKTAENEQSATQNPFIVEINLRPRYSETDAQGVVHHSNYVNWFEVARVEYCGAVGYPYIEIEKQGYGFMVTDLKVKYLSPARFDDKLVIRCWLERLGRASCVFGYQIWNETSGQLSVEGMTKHAAVTLATGKLARFDRALYETLVPRVGRGPSKYGILTKEEK